MASLDIVESRSLVERAWGLLRGSVVWFQLGSVICKGVVVEVTWYGDIHVQYVDMRTAEVRLLTFQVGYACEGDCYSYVGVLVEMRLRGVLMASYGGDVPSQELLAALATEVLNGVTVQIPWSYGFLLGVVGVVRGKGLVCISFPGCRTPLSVRVKRAMQELIDFS